MMDIEQMKAYLDSDEGKLKAEKFFKKLELEQEHKHRWIDRVWNRIKDDIDGSIEHLLNWYYSDKYRDREYKKGYVPREELLWILLGAAEKYGSEVGDDYEFYANPFTGEMFQLGSYIIQVMYGQGSAIRIDKIS